jgi:hypothetical protein
MFTWQLLGHPEKLSSNKGQAPSFIVHIIFAAFSNACSVFFLFIRTEFTAFWELILIVGSLVLLPFVFIILGGNIYYSYAGLRGEGGNY